MSWEPRLGPARAKAGEVVIYDEARQVIGTRAADFHEVVQVWMVAIRSQLRAGEEIKAVRGRR